MWRYNTASVQSHICTHKSKQMYHFVWIAHILQSVFGFSFGSYYTVKPINAIPNTMWCLSCKIHGANKYYSDHCKPEAYNANAVHHSLAVTHWNVKMSRNTGYPDHVFIYWQVHYCRLQEWFSLFTLSHKILYSLVCLTFFYWGAQDRCISKLEYNQNVFYYFLTSYCTTDKNFQNQFISKVDYRK